MSAHEAPPMAKDISAEAALLGSLILDPNRIDEVTPIVVADDFFLNSHRLVYETMLVMHNADKRIDVTLLANRLKPDAEMFEDGNIPWALSQFVETVPNAFHAAYYAEVVREKAMLRSLDRAGEQIQALSGEHRRDPRELLNEAEQKVFAILERHTAGDTVDLKDVLIEAMTAIGARSERGRADGVLTGYRDLDALIGGLRPGELIILAARTSMGKTAFALNVCERVATEGVGCLFVSLEMNKLELAERMLCCHAKVDGRKMRNGFLSQLDRKSLIESSAILSKSNIAIDSTSTRSVNEIAATARRMKRKSGLGLVVVDYLGFVKPDNPRDPRQEQVATISRRLKGLARELHVPVLCVAQLNRQSDTDSTLPKLSQLRESGAIEQDADVVLFVHRKDYYREQRDWDHKALVIVAKNRNGPTGASQLAWFQQYMRFETLAAEDRTAAEEYTPSGDYTDHEFQKSTPDPQPF